MTRERPGGLLAHAVLLCTLLTVGTALAVGAVLMWAISRQVDTSADVRLRVAGDAFNHVLAGEQEAMVALGSALATRPQIINALSAGRSGAVEDVLRLVLREPIDELLVANLDGAVIARVTADNGSQGESNVGGPRSFEEAASGRARTAIGRNASGLPQQEVYIPIPLDSNPRWVLRLADYIDQAELERLRLSSRLEMGLVVNSSRVAGTLRSSEGQLLLEPPNRQLLASIDQGASEAFGWETTPAGTFRTRYSPLLDERGSHLATLTLMVPYSTLLSQLRTAVLPAAPVLILVVLAAGALAVLLVTRLTRPILELKGAAQRLQQGDLETPVPSVGEPLLEPLRAELEWARASIAGNQRALKEAQERYRDLVENTPHMVCLHDLDGRVLYANPAALQLLECADLSRRPNLQELMAADARAEFTFYIAAIREKGFAQGLMSIRGGGQPRVLNYNASLRQEPAAGDEVIRLIADDVTDRFASLALRNAIFAGAREPMLAVDADERVVLHNAAARDLFTQDLDAHPPATELMPFLAHDVPGSRAAATRGALVAADGKRLEVEVTRTVLRDGLPIGALYVVHDVSAMAELSRQREELLHDVAHELRGPISVLDNALTIAADGSADMTAAELDGILSSARRMAKRLEDLVGDMLSAGSIQAGKFTVHPRPMSLGELVDNAMENMYPRTALTGQRIVCQLPETNAVVLADPVYAVRVLTNLLSNASKYSQAGATIELRTELLGYDVKISIVDHGMGIPLEQQASIFERYYRASGNREQPGVGLGLAIAKAVVEAHSGTIGMSSQPGAGSTFWFTLPLQASALAVSPRVVPSA